MERAKPVLFLGTVACLLLGMFPFQAFSQSAPTCIGNADTNNSWLFQDNAFVEVRNVNIVSQNEIAFLNVKLDNLLRSQIVSTEIPFELTDDYTVSRVVFEKETLNTTCNACPTCELIEFQIALDCNVCTRDDSGTMCCVHNHAPQWINVEFNPADTRKRVEIDTLGMGFIGSQLCWRGVLSAQKQTAEKTTCKPTLKQLRIGYQAIKSGEYSRSSPMPVANMAFVASYITPKSQFDSEASTQAVTAAKDYSRRGMVRAYELYDPEFPKTTTKKLKWSLKSGISAPSFLDYGGVRYHQKGPLQTQGTWSATETDVFDEYFSSAQCKLPENLLVYDLNRSNSCDNKDISVLKNWMIGFDSDTTRANGAIPTAFDLSTPAFISLPIIPPPWVRLATQAEVKNYNTWKGGRKSGDSALLWLGSTTGELYGIDAGSYVPEERDGCLNSVRHLRGFFKPLPGCPKNADGTLQRYTGELIGTYPGAGKVKTVYRPWAFRPSYVYEYNKRYYGTSYQSQFSILRPSMNASLAFVDVDFMSPKSTTTYDFENPNLPLTWDLDQGQGYRPKGGHSLIAMSSGPNQSLFQILFSGRDERIYYLWELDFKTNTKVKEFWDKTSQYSKPRFGRNSSRHTPLTGRFMFNKPTQSLSVGVAKWLAIVGSDYKPGVDASGNPLAGAVYFVDLYTGELLDLSTYFSGASWAGLTLLETGEGIGGEMVGLDLQHQSVERPRTAPDGIYDIVYIPTTLGRVYRINTLRHENSSNARFGDAFSKCKIIDIPEILKTVAGLDSENAKRQGIYSNIGVYQDEKTVRIYVGTADNPDIYDKQLDPPATSYYILAFELDESSVGTNACKAATLLWFNKLPPGEKVWGGVTVSPTEIAVGTAAGGSSDVCGLDSKQQGNLYILAANTGEFNQPPISAQIVSPPVAFDGHYLYIGAENNLEIIASEGISGWNNDPEASQEVNAPTMKLLNQSVEQDIRLKKSPSTP